MCLYMRESKYRFCYLSLIQNDYSKEEVGCLSVKLLRQNTVSMLCVWLLNEWMILPKVMHHSDRGVLHTSNPVIKNI